MSDRVAVLRLVDRPQPGGGRTVAVTWTPPDRTPVETTVAVDVTVDPGLGGEAALVSGGLRRVHRATRPDDRRRRPNTMLAQLGRTLFTAVFGAGRGRDIWAQASLGGLEETRVEVDADPGDVPGLPWELLRDPATDRPLVITAAQFVRTHRQATQSAPVPQPDRDHLRVLLVICRPDRQRRCGVPVGRLPPGPRRRRPARGPGPGRAAPGHVPPAAGGAARG